MRHQCSKCGHTECVVSINARALSLIERFGPMSATLVAERLAAYAERKTVYQTVKRLERQGLVRRERGRDLPWTRYLYRVTK